MHAQVDTYSRAGTLMRHADLHPYIHVSTHASARTPPPRTQTPIHPSIHPSVHPTIHPSIRCLLKCYYHLPAPCFPSPSLSLSLCLSLSLSLWLEDAPVYISSYTRRGRRTQPEEPSRYVLTSDQCLSYRRLQPHTLACCSPHILRDYVMAPTGFCVVKLRFPAAAILSSSAVVTVVRSLFLH